MRDSNSFHACCLDTFPPLFYLNDKSKILINLIHKFNEKEVTCGYTFDAGPNCLILVKKTESTRLSE